MKRKKPSKKKVLSQRRKKPRHKFLPFESEWRKRGFRFVVGLDEAGRGPWAGPLVCAAVWLPPYIRLKGLNDSKLVRKEVRESLFQKIRQKCAFGIGVVPSQDIDRLGLIKACERGFLEAVEGVLKKIGASFPEVFHRKPMVAFLVDGNDHFSFTLQEAKHFHYQSIIRGDRRVRSIAAASILAKVHRDRLMEELDGKFPMYAFRRHKGYGTKLHQKLLKKFGVSEIHRLSYRPIKAMMAIVSRKKGAKVEA